MSKLHFLWTKIYFNIEMYLWRGDTCHVGTLFEVSPRHRFYCNILCEKNCCLIWQWIRYVTTVIYNVPHKTIIIHYILTNNTYFYHCHASVPQTKCDRRAMLVTFFFNILIRQSGVETRISQPFNSRTCTLINIISHLETRSLGCPNCKCIPLFLI